MDIQSWIQEHLLDAEVSGKIVKVKEVGNFLIVEPKYYILEKDREVPVEVVESLYESHDGLKSIRIFDDAFRIILTPAEANMVSDESLEIDYFLFQFGDRFYYCDDTDEPVLNEFKYIGKAVKELEFEFPYLGIHGAYDLCNGSRDYTAWCKKAKFLGINTLGIAEENTLAGILDFQNACKDAGIKSIIGETVSVKNGMTNYTVKLYVQNEEGWKNLLRINAQINVENNGFIYEKDLLEFHEGLFCLLTPECNLDELFMTYFCVFGQRLLYQFDLSEWDGAEKDRNWCESINNYLKNYISKLPHLLVYDSYYLDKDDAPIRKILNKIGKTKFKNNSKNQWFKSIEQVFYEISELFNTEDDRMFSIVETGCNNLVELCNNIDFKVEIGKLKLPKYKMTEEENAKYNGNSMDMIIDLIGAGFEKKIAGNVEDEELYWDRIQTELSVIEKGDVIDYFLILWDIIRFCKEEDIWVGVGRGSAAGCMVSYLLDIVKIDPIKYGLFFERFLNEGRIGKSLPDIDTDFEGERRGEVKRYIEDKYGKDYVTSIGTYSTMKVKAAIGDLSRCAGVPASLAKLATKMIDPEFSFTEFIKLASQNQYLKEFVQKYPKVIESIPLCMNQPKTSSIHAAGVVIVPDEYGTIYEQMPVKKMDGVLVSEWEGTFIEKAGFLKCDILGIKQLDKFAAISRLIEKTQNKKITFDDIDLDQEAVYSLFQEGYNEDVFQFGTAGLKAYCKKLKPDNMEDLIAAVALYRPATMDTGVHEKYIKVKNGIEDPVYWYGCEGITSKTYAQIIYQEQVMSIVQVLGGFTLVEADDIRKAMGKKDKELLDSYKSQFIAGAIGNGCPPEEADYLWQAMETFSGYAFNRSHAASYAITGYYSQWFKVNYPLEFWTIALHFAGDDELLSRIAEINKVSNIKVVSPHINKSKESFQPDPETNNIYWSITSIKWVGGSAIKDIQDEKEKNGNFFSFEEFIERTDQYRSVNKRVVKHLILSGAFDEIEGITPVERYRLIKFYYDYRKIQLDEDLATCESWKEHKWIMVQRSVSGSGYIDFLNLVERSEVFASQQKKYAEINELVNHAEDGNEYVTSGIVNDIRERDSRNGKYCFIEIQDNTEKITVTMWNDVYAPNKDMLLRSLGRIMNISGKISHYNGKNNLQSNKNTLIEIL